MVQKIKSDEHSKFVEFLLEKSKKQDPKPCPINHEGVDIKEIERLTKEVQDRGSTRTPEKKRD